LDDLAGFSPGNRNSKTVIVGGDFNASRISIKDWLIDATVTEGQLVGFEPKGST
jgi:endonuclease/exonuclease/phosphatase (EEP) superfamily protein YafD